MSLVEKSKPSYNYFSRYQEGKIYYDVTDKKYIDLALYWLDDTTPYILYEVVRGDTYDSIALNVYNNPTYWWVITDFNRVMNPFEKPVVGSSIKIPIFSNLQFKGVQ